MNVVQIGRRLQLDNYTSVNHKAGASGSDLYAFAIHGMTNFPPEIYLSGCQSGRFEAHPDCSTLWGRLRARRHEDRKHIIRYQGKFLGAARVLHVQQ